MHTQNCTYLQILVGNYQHILQRTSVAFDFVLACCIAGVSGKENCYHQLATHLKNSTVDSHCSACWGCPGGGQRLEWLQLTKQLSGWRQAWHFLRGFPPDLPPPPPSPWSISSSDSEAKEPITWTYGCCCTQSTFSSVCSQRCLT